VNKASTRILMIIIILAFAAMACIGGGGGDGDRAGSNSDISSAQSNLRSPDATATFGAQQLHIQLTEIARPSQ
jgi:hypothetical protein